jgi:hypothetical protein
MLIGFAFLLVVHGLIHALGFAKAFGLADLPQLREPIPVMSGVVWLVAGLLFIASAIALFAWQRGWWIVAAAAVFLSLLAIASSWNDAKFGLIANGLVAAGIACRLLGKGPFGLS